MGYLATSALVPAFIHEAKGEAVIGWLVSTRERLVPSEWGITEFSRAAAMKTRTGEITTALAKQARTRFLDYAQTHCAIAVPQNAEFWHAAELAGDAARKLRAGDALHLANAEASKADAVFCLDEAMAVAAKDLGFNLIAI
jgi:predicted nucleic acid-binding protein